MIQSSLRILAEKAGSIKVKAHFRDGRPVKEHTRRSSPKPSRLMTADEYRRRSKTEMVGAGNYVGGAGTSTFGTSLFNTHNNTYHIKNYAIHGLGKRSWPDTKTLYAIHHRILPNGWSHYVAWPADKPLNHKVLREMDSAYMNELFERANAALGYN